mgnify:CR=1 FL=1
MELIQKVKKAYAIYNRVDRINGAIKQKHRLSDVFEELSHYPKSILILTIIESVRRSSSEIDNQNIEETYNQAVNLVNDAFSIAEKIDINLVNDHIKKVH